MLVLSRKRGEGIVIGEGITVTVLEIRGDRVKLGFACPVEVPIHRSEVRRSIEKDSLAQDRRDACDGAPLAMGVDSVWSGMQGVSR